jgi:hypothetical protein
MLKNIIINFILIYIIKIIYFDEKHEYNDYFHVIILKKLIFNLL